MEEGKTVRLPCCVGLKKRVEWYKGYAMDNLQPELALSDVGLDARFAYISSTETAPGMSWPVSVICDVHRLLSGLRSKLFLCFHFFLFSFSHSF